VVSSLLSLQSGYIKDPSALQVLQESQNRVMSMALIHEKLYQAGSLVRIDIAEYLRGLATSVFRSYRARANAVRLRMDVADVSLDVDHAMTCGLIINELISNSLKYAFPEHRNPTDVGGVGPEIHVELRDLPDRWVSLRVEDNGIGIPESIDISKAGSLGLQLVDTLTDQLKGTLELRRSGGTCVTIRFPC
jgi:two-component sensor histidine kinase